MGPVAVAAVLALAGIVALFTVTGSGDASPAQALAAELRCPDCQALSVAESRTAAANAIRTEISAQLAAGRTPAEVRRHFVDRYGEWILLRPASPVAWLLPLAAIAAAVALLAAWLLRRGGPQAPPPPALDEPTRRRLADETDSLDA